jgi:hypothetical protein
MMKMVKLDIASRCERLMQEGLVERPVFITCDAR